MPTPLSTLIDNVKRNRAINKARRKGRRKYLGQKKDQRKKRRKFIKAQRGSGSHRTSGGILNVLP